MNLIRKVFLFLILVSLTSKTYSQYSLSFGNVDPIISDTAYMESLLGISLTIVNIGSDDINFPISVSSKVNSENFYELAYFYFDDDDPLLVGDSFSLNWPEFDPSSGLIYGGFIEVNQETGFFNGDNIIVVWPSVSTQFINQGEIVSVEQYVHSVHVIDAVTTLSTHPKSTDLTVVISSNWIEVKSEKTIELIEIYNLEGQKILIDRDTKINIQNLAAGLYLVSASLTDRSKKYVKILIH